METKITTPVVKGLIISLVLIVFTLALHFSENTMNQGLSSLQYLILLGGVIWGCINYANQMNHNVTFGNVFAHGFKITAVVTVITIIYSVIAFKFLFPEMMDMIINKSREQMSKSGKMSDSDMETALGFTRKFMLPLMMGGILVFFMVCGLIASLIGAAAAKKNPQGPFQQTI